MSKITQLKSIMMVDSFVDVHLPNAIFDTIQQSALFKNWQQEAYAYTFYYLSSFLYRNCIYAKVSDLSLLTVTAIKKDFLGIGSRTLDAVHKKDGILDLLGLTCTHYDFPVNPVIQRSRLDGFYMYRELKSEVGEVPQYTVPPSFQIKVPLLGLYSIPPKDYVAMLKKRDTDKEVDDILSYTDGHFFDFTDTHKIQIECLIACLSNPKLGYKGFYLYGFYRRQSDRFKGGYNASIEQIQNIIPISTKTLYQYHVELEKMNLITKTVIPHTPNTYKASSHVPTIEI